jgi:trehalose 6-phosphate synthase/phosphatase
MLSADVVGFHAFDHARHFLNACKRVMGLAYHNKSGCADLPADLSV